NDLRIHADVMCDDHRAWFRGCAWILLDTPIHHSIDHARLGTRPDCFGVARPDSGLRTLAAFRWTVGDSALGFLLVRADPRGPADIRLDVGSHNALGNDLPHRLQALCQFGFASRYRGERGLRRQHRRWNCWKFDCWIRSHSSLW